jgi:transcriptional regulator GlxA family with amidase domain
MEINPNDPASPTSSAQAPVVKSVNSAQAPAVLDAENPYLLRVQRLVRTWVQEEWEAKEAIRAKMARNSRLHSLLGELAEATLNPENLAHRLDNISVSKLRRELRKLGAPSPGELIRDARMEYARHLLTHTRLLVREVAERAGYANEKFFTRSFVEKFGAVPTEYRRASIGNQ